EACSLEQELQRLFSPGAGPILPGLLQALGRLAEVSSAAVYRLARSGRALGRVAASGELTAFPEKIESHSAVIAWSAVATGKLTTCRDPLRDRQLTSQPYIAVLPLAGGGE